jgi:hypothetical protein
MVGVERRGSLPELTQKEGRRWFRTMLSREPVLISN